MFPHKHDTFCCALAYRMVFSIKMFSIESRNKSQNVNNCYTTHNLPFYCFMLLHHSQNSCIWQNDLIQCEQSKCLSRVRGSSSLVSCWTQDQTRAGWHGFQYHLGQLIFIKNLSLIFSVNTRCHYLLEPSAFIPLYRDDTGSDILRAIQIYSVRYAAIDSDF